METDRDTMTAAADSVEKSSRPSEVLTDEDLSDNASIDSFPRDDESWDNIDTVAAPALTSIPEVPELVKKLDILTLDDELAYDGYDSDGYTGPDAEPFEDVHEEAVLSDLDVVPRNDNEESLDPPGADLPTCTQGIFVDMSENDIMGLKVDELKIELDKRGINKAGKKLSSKTN